MIKMLNSIIGEVLNSDFMNCKKIPKKQGVYLIFQKNRLIYVGESINLHKRINSQHISGSKTNKTSAFRKSLCNRDDKKPGVELKKWILDNCKFKYTKIEDSDLCHLVEKALIYKLRKKYNLLNK